MPTADRRTREKERRRNDIVDVAEQLFFSRGFENVTTDDIARAAELARGTLYLYFKNRDDIYIAVAARGLSILNGLFHEAAARGGTGIAKVRSLLLALYEFSVSHPGHFAIIGGLGARGFDADRYPGMREVERIHGDSLRLVIGAFELGVRDGTVRSDVDPMKAAFVLTASMQALLAGASDRDLVEYGVDMMLRAVEAPR